MTYSVLSHRLKGSNLPQLENAKCLVTFLGRILPGAESEAHWLVSDVEIACLKLMLYVSFSVRLLFSWLINDSFCQYKMHLNYK